jgi:hypothetical protein
MKTKISIVVLVGALPFLLAACGKKEGSSSSPSSINQPLSPSQPLPPIPPTPNNEFVSWCQSYMGQLNSSSTLCQFTSISPYGNSFNLNVGTVNLGLEIYPADTIYLEVTGSPDLVIGQQRISSVRSGTYYIATNAGYLELHGRSLTSSFSIRKVELRRCFDSSRNSVQCPLQ